MGDLTKRVKAAGGGAPIEAQVRSMRRAFVTSSRIVSRPMEDTHAIAALLAQYEGLTVLFDGLGAVVSQVAPTAPHRAPLRSHREVQINKETSLDDWHDAQREVSQIRSALKTLCGGGAYINYIDPTMADWARASYGDNLPRLRRVAHRVDPDGFFAFAQGILRP